MKKHLLTLSLTLLLSLSYWACNEHDVIYFDELPPAAQAFLQRYFPDNLVATAERHSEEPFFKVTLDNGFEIDFYSDGRWQEIDSRHAILPAELVQGVLPEKILNYLEQEFPLAGVSSVERSSIGYIIELDTSPSTELFFDPEGNVAIHWDD